MAQKDKVEPFVADEEFKERLEKALRETDFREPSRVPFQLSSNCCPHCWMHMPIGA